jgi:menaquinone-dependent protoporphyrinogen IX oxidase
MNDTPETDKATIASGGDWCPVLRETCRRLERERDNEMKWHHQTHKELVEIQCKLMDITQERDEAMAKYDTLVMENMLEVNKLCKERDEAIEKHRFAVMHWQIGVFKMQRERDEALEELRKLKIILDVIKNETL